MEFEQFYKEITKPTARKTYIEHIAAISNYSDIDIELKYTSYTTYELYYILYIYQCQLVIDAINSTATGKISKLIILLEDKTLFDEYIKYDLFNCVDLMNKMLYIVLINSCDTEIHNMYSWNNFNMPIEIFNIIKPLFGALFKRSIKRCHKCKRTVVRLSEVCIFNSYIYHARCSPINTPGTIPLIKYINVVHNCDPIAIVRNITMTTLDNLVGLHHKLQLLNFSISDLITKTTTDHNYSEQLYKIFSELYKTKNEEKCKMQCNYLENVIRFDKEYHLLLIKKHYPDKLKQANKANVAKIKQKKKELKRIEAKNKALIADVEEEARNISQKVIDLIRSDLQKVMAAEEARTGLPFYEILD